MTLYMKIIVTNFLKIHVKIIIFHKNNMKKLTKSKIQTSILLIVIQIKKKITIFWKNLEFCKIVHLNLIIIIILKILTKIKS